jgi:RNA polymerase sigma-70 factor (ECF subfamily)
MDTVIRQVLAGDTSQYRQVVERYQQPLLAFLLARGLQPADAEDIAQETLLQAFRCLHQYRDRYAFSTWLYTIARRLAAKAQKNRRDDTTLEDSHALAHDSHAPEEASLWQYLRQQLSRDDFDLLWFYYVEEMPVKALAELFGQSQSAVKMRLLRLRNKIQAQLSSEDQPVECGGFTS